MPSARSLAGTVLNHVLRRNAARVRRNLKLRLGHPWMRPYEEDLIREVISGLQPLRCLEWGGGMSTLQFPALIPAAATWLTIEHDTAWSRELSAMVTRPGVTVRHVPPDDPNFSGDGDAQSFASYLAAGDEAAPYDLVFIDGRARADCIRRARGLLNPDGVVILHDANRQAYLAGAGEYASQELFQDRRRQGPRVSGGVWLGSPRRDLSTVCDLEFQRRLWDFYNGRGRRLA